MQFIFMFSNMQACNTFIFIKQYFVFVLFFLYSHTFHSPCVSACVCVFAYALLNLAYFKFITLGLQPGAAQINNNNNGNNICRHRYMRISKWNIYTIYVCVWAAGFSRNNNKKSLTEKRKKTILHTHTHTHTDCIHVNKCAHACTARSAVSTFAWLA